MAEKDQGGKGTIVPTAILVICAALLAGMRGPAGLVVPLSLAATIAVLAHAVQGRRRGMLDALVVGTSGLIITLIALGFVLDQLPAGISTASWAVGAAITGLLVLLACALVPVRQPPRVRRDLVGPPQRIRGAYGWYSLGLATFVVALVIASRATTDATAAPLALSLTSATGTPDILVQAGVTNGNYEIVVGDADSTAIWRGPFSLAPHQQRSFPVDSVTRGAPILTLRRPGTTIALRTLLTGY